MSSNNTHNITVSMPWLGLLGVLFVGLKLTGYINWSWWWVTLPFWGGLALVLGIVLVTLGGAAALIGAASLITKIEGLWKKRHGKTPKK